MAGVQNMLNDVNKQFDMPTFNTGDSVNDDSETVLMLSDEHKMRAKNKCPANDICHHLNMPVEMDVHRNIVAVHSPDDIQIVDGNARNNATTKTNPFRPSRDKSFGEF